MVHHCIRRQCFILLPNVWVVFKIYFAILHKIVAINNIQSIRLNKQNEKKKKFSCFCTTSGQPCYTSRSFAFKHMAAWKRCSDMQKVCGNIFEDRNIQLNLNVHHRFGGDLVKSFGYTIFILIYAESVKSIRMLAYRVSFCCC